MQGPHTPVPSPDEAPGPEPADRTEPPPAPDHGPVGDGYEPL